MSKCAGITSYICVYVMYTDNVIASLYQQVIYTSKYTVDNIAETWLQIPSKFFENFEQLGKHTSYT